MTQPPQGHRGGRGRRHQAKPFRQGDLDGLCGVYSVVNAVHALCPELGAGGAAWLFGHLMQALHQAGADTSRAVAEGIGQRLVTMLLAEAIAQMTAEYDIDLTVKRLPKALRLTANLDGVWRAIAEALSPACVAVLGMAGRHCHWTVAIGATARQIRLFDSATMQMLRRRDCTVATAVKRTGISPPHVFLITRRRHRNEDQPSRSKP